MFFGPSPQDQKLRDLEEKINQLHRDDIELSNRINQLNNEDAETQKKIKQIETRLRKKTADYEEEAKEASERIAEYLESITAIKTSIDNYITEIQPQVQEIKEEYSSFEDTKIKIDECLRIAKDNSESVSVISENVTTEQENIQEKLSELEKIIDGKDVLEEKISRVEEIHARGNEYDSKLSALNKGIQERKKEIDDLYYEIIGYTEDNEETGEANVVTGLKDELESAYTEIKKQLDQTVNRIDFFESETIDAYNKFTDGKQKEYLQNFEEWQVEHNSIVNKINELLPRALTAGLSYAYQEKKEKEEIEYTTLSKNFTIAIWGLIAISSIPVMVSIFSLLNKATLEETILRVPRLVLAILPLYIPVLWVAYSSNKKRNLSKRLIEEYSHKETLSKTFEGLAKQIDNVEDKTVSGELKTNLLYNILQVNSENPGKLISDYNKADHPLMDALDKSIQLTNAVSRLSKIPGFNKLASTLEKRAEKMLEKEDKKASAGLDTISENKSEVDANKN